ncbi:MAG: hypothetical protein ACK5OG_04835, partial [Sphingomonadaceae bacterium]
MAKVVAQTSISPSATHDWSFNDQPWVADGFIDVWATTLPDSNLLDRLREGAQVTLLGTTADNFIEVKL